MKRNPSFLKLLQLGAYLLLGLSPLWGQNRTVSGTVLDASSGEPVIGAYVSLAGSNRNGAITNLLIAKITA